MGSPTPPGRRVALLVTISLAMAMVTPAGAQPADTATPIAPLCASVTAVDGPCEAWTDAYDGPASGFDAAGGLSTTDILATSRDGEVVYAAGTSESTRSTEHFDAVIVAYAARTGVRRWVARYAPEPLPRVTPFAIAVSADGDTVVVTGSAGTLDDDKLSVVTVGLDASSGKQLWAAIDAKPGFSARGLSLAADPREPVVYAAQQVFRTVPTGRAVSYGVVAAYDISTGSQLWSRRYRAGPDVSTLTMKVQPSPDGSRLFVAGGLVDADGMTVASTLRVLDPSTGALQTSDRQPMYGAAAAGMVVSPDGDQVFVVHADSPGAKNRLLTLAFDGDANLEWRAEFGGGSTNDCPTRPWYHGPITVTPDGAKVIVTSLGGCPNAATTGFDTVAYDAQTGARDWVARLAGNAGDCVCGPVIAAHPDSSEVYVTGLLHAAGGSFDTTTVAYDVATGAQRWVVTHAEGRNSPSDITVTPDGSRVVVAGARSLHVDSTDFLVVAYELD
jgi:hypothetical protein